MVTFSCKVNNPGGMPAKIAGLLVEKATLCSGDVLIRNGEKTGNAKLIFNVLCLSVKCGDELEFTVEGDNEAEDAEMLKNFLTELL